MILIIILYLLFASTFTLGKAALSYVSPFLFIAIRMLLGGGLLLGYYACTIRRSLIIQNSKDYLLFAQVIIFHIFCAYTLEFWALTEVTSAKACLLYNLSPFVTAILYYFLRGERLTYRQVCGLIIGFLGFIPILIAQTPLEAMSWHVGFLSCYEIALILSVISSAYGWIIVKYLMDKKYALIFINGIGMTGGGLMSLCLSFFKEGLPIIKDTGVAMPIVAQAIGTTGEHLIMLSCYSMALVFIANIVGYNLYGYLLSQYSATFLSFAGFITPLFAALLGWIFLNEQVTWHFFVTVGFVILGLYLFYEKNTAL